MSEDFFFAVARISCAQIFRAAGIERCSPQLLDVLADLFIRHIQLLATSATRYAELCGNSEVCIKDVQLAMEQRGVIRPRSMLDYYDTDPWGLAGWIEFINWAEGPIPKETRRISQITCQTNLLAAESTAKALNEVYEKKDEIIGSIKKEGEENGSVPPEKMKSATPAPVIPAPSKTTEYNEEWLKGLMRIQAKVDYEARFKGTVVSEDRGANVSFDTNISGGPSSISEFYETQTEKLKEQLQSIDLED